MNIKFEDGRMNMDFENQNPQKKQFKMDPKLFSGNIPRSVPIIGFIILLIYMIVEMPILSPQYPQYFLFFILFATTVILMFYPKIKVLKLTAAAIVIFMISSWILTTPILWSSKYYEILGEVPTYQYEEKVPNISEDLVPVVDLELAQRLGDKKMGEDLGLGSQFTIGEYYFVKTEDDLVWVAPLEPLDIFKWYQNRNGAPGYVYVSATNPNDVRLIQENDGEKLAIKYTKAAYFFKDINRHVYLNGYFTTGLTDYSFEIDDQMNPYWVITTYAPSFNFWAGNQATGVLVVDAQTGEINQYKTGEEPDWVERVYPTSFINKQVEYWGRYKNGWLNSIFTQKEVIQPSVGFSYAFIDGEPYYYTGMTSVQSDESTVGLMMVSLKTRQSIFYKLTGATESAAISSAEGQVQQYGYRASFPIFLNVYDEPTYFMPLKDQEGLIKQYSFVSVENYNIVGIGNTYDEAKLNYYEKLKENNIVTNASTDESVDVEGEIERINYIGDNVYIKIKGDESIYTAEVKSNRMFLLAITGDKVTVKANKIDDNYYQIIEFNNTTFVN